MLSLNTTMKQLARNLHSIILGLESEFGMNNFQTDHVNCASSEQRNAIISVPDASVPIGAVSYSCAGVLSGTSFLHMWFSTPTSQKRKRRLVFICHPMIFIFPFIILQVKHAAIQSQDLDSQQYPWSQVPCLSV